MESEERVIRVQCDSCDKKLKVSERHFGKKVKCPGCGSSIAIKAPDTPVINRFVPATKRHEQRNESNEAPDLLSELLKHDFGTPQRIPEDKLEDVLAQLSGKIQRPKVRLLYALTGTVVLGVMLLLPVIYFGIIVAISWGTYWHATHNGYWLVIFRGRLAFPFIVLYFGIIIAGALWALSMLKPFLYMGDKKEALTGVERDQEPLLYNFADRIADVVGSPRPDFIHISTEVNASASFQTSVFGIFRNKFCLTIGAPLIAGLTLSQLAGVIAHEFGHFTQSRGTFLTRMIAGINSWFANAIFQHDTIDDYIESLTDTPNVIVSLIGFIFWAGVNAGRGILYLLMLLGISLSRTLSRQMEFNADQFETELAGSETFAKTFERIVELSIAAGLAQEYIFTSLNADYLPRDYPSFVAALSTKFEKVKKKAKKVIRNEKANWFASHPPTRVRIATAEKLNRKGIFHSKLPATKLMPRFKSDSENVTTLMYLMKFGPNFGAASFRSTSDAVDNYLQVFGKKQTAN